MVDSDATPLARVEASTARMLLMSMPGAAFKVNPNPASVPDLLEALVIIKVVLQQQFDLVATLQAEKQQRDSDLEAVRRVFGL